jgi:uncharacterized membrane protein YoaK (UPF0700 family)
MLPEKEFRSILTAACVLAAIGGHINGFALIYIGRGLTHMTGNTTSVGAGAAKGSFDMTFHSINAICGFFFGSMMSGALLRNQSFKVRRRYGVGLIIEAILLSFAWILLSQSSNVSQGPAFWIGEFAIATAAGLQNGLMATYSSAIIRTTHVSGVIADMGVIVGHMIFHRDFRGLWKLTIFVPLYSAFLFFGWVGAASALAMGPVALVFPIILLFLSGCVAFWLRILYRRHLRRKSVSSAPTLLSEVKQAILEDDIDADDDVDGRQPSSNGEDPEVGQYVPPHPTSGSRVDDNRAALI